MSKRYVIKRRAGAPDRLARYREELNAEQFAVVTAPPGPVLVIAGAGSGKTRAITYRVAYLIEQGIAPARIMLATFTNRAAREMLKRVEQLTGGEVRRVWGGTFHRIANLILRRHAESIGYDHNYSILDAEDARDLLAVCVQEAGVDTRARRFPKAEVLQDIISFATNTDQPIPDVVARRYPYFEPLTEQIKRVDVTYMERKHARNVMDYDDLLLNWKRLLLEREEIARLYSEQFEHVLVDEYQDTNKLQAELVDLLAVRHRNVMVVGDDAQSIFAWRGAEWANIYEFPERYPDARQYRLETNYRSTAEILAVANVSIASNRKQFPKELRAVRPTLSLPPALVPCRDAEQQATFVAARVLELREEGVPLADVAVLYRSHYHSLELQLELTRRGIPYRIRSGVRFFEQAHIKDVLAYLRLVTNPRDELAWQRVLKLIPNVGPATAARIWEQIAFAPDPLAMVVAGGADNAARRGTTWAEFRALISELAREEVRASPARQIELVLARGYAAYLAASYENADVRLEDLRQLAQYSARYNSTEEFLGELALLSTERYGAPQPLTGEDVVSGGDEDELLTLTSVHQAKGLEWRAVFIIWAADGRFPAPRSLREAEGEDEERRLWYVALTRARDQLYITYPQLSADYNRRETVVQRPSRFVTEVPPELYEIWSLEEEAAALPDAPPPVPDEEPGGYLN